MTAHLPHRWDGPDAPDARHRHCRDCGEQQDSDHDRTPVPECAVRLRAALDEAEARGRRAGIEEVARMCDEQEGRARHVARRCDVAVESVYDEQATVWSRAATMLRAAAKAPPPASADMGGIAIGPHDAARPGATRRAP